MKDNLSAIEKVLNDFYEGLKLRHPDKPVDELEKEYDHIKDMVYRENRKWRNE